MPPATRIGVANSRSLQSLISTRFNENLQSDALVFSQTEAASIRPSAIPYHFQVRYCPALEQKAASLATAREKPQKTNPFENPDPQLFITELPHPNPSHYVILNKFPIIPGHFLLVTKQFKSQTNLLEKNDLTAAFSILKGWSTGGSSAPSLASQLPASPPSEQTTPLFAFFNSGEHSGASQLHRHIQFLPVKGIQHEQAERWQPLTDRLLPPNPAPSAEIAQPLQLPFTYFTARLSEDPSPDELHNAYLSLYRRAEDSVRSYAAHQNDSDSKERGEKSEMPVPAASEDSPASICYNLAITNEGMVICPRLSGGATVELDNDHIDPGLHEEDDRTVVWEFNGTLLAGTLLVKSRMEFEALLKNPDLMSKALAAIGVPSDLMSKM